jgi:integrase
MSTIKHQFQIGKPNKENQSSILYLFNLKGKRFKYGAGKTIIPELWNNETQRPTDDKKVISKFFKVDPTIKTDLENTRQRLDNIISLSNKYINSKELQNENVNFDELKEFLNNQFTPEKKKVEKKAIETPHNDDTLLLSTIIKDFYNGMVNGSKTIQQPISKRGQRYDIGTLKAYNSFRNLYNEFEIQQNKEYKITDISIEFETDLHDFFNEVKEYTPNYKGKLIKMLKVIVTDFIETNRKRLYDNDKKGITGTLTLNDLYHIEHEIKRILKPNSEPIKIYLNDNDIEALYNLDLNNVPHFDKARDIFLTGCYTALRHSDYKRISLEHIQNDWLQIINEKTTIKTFVPIRPELRTILKKWKNKIPEMSSQKLGKYIKEIGKLANIDDIIETIEIRGNEKQTVLKRKYELITTHTARRSAATNMYNSGMNIKDIMSITGHTKIETFEKYIIKDEKARQIRLQNSDYFKGRPTHLKVV